MVMIYEHPLEKKVRGNIVYSATMSLKEAVGKVQEMTLMLRKEILRTKNPLFPKDLKLSDIEKGEVEIPELISISYRNLIARPDSRLWKGSRKATRT